MRLLKVVFFFVFGFYSLQILYANVSYPSGFYSGLDSLLFEVFWDLDEYEKLQISVNHSQYFDYEKGVYLKDLSYTDNEWENVHLTRENSNVTVSFQGKGNTTLKIDGKHEGNYKLSANVRVIKIVKNKAVIELKVYVNNELSFFDEKRLNINDKMIFESNVGWRIICDDCSQFVVGDSWDIHFKTNQQLNYPVNYLAERGDLRKVNTVKVRSIDTLSGRTIRDSVYIIGLFEYPYDRHSLFVTAESDDIKSVLKDYEDKSLKKDANLHIFSPLGKVEYNGNVKFRKAAGSSRYLPNHGLSFNARKKNLIATTLFNDQRTEIDKIKFRVGGNDQSRGFSSHEIVLDILSQNPQLKLLGGVKNSIAVLYLNGSYWSMGFPQQKPNKYFYSDLLDIDGNKVDIFGVTPFLFTIDSIVNDVKGTFIFPDLEFQKQFGTQSKIFINKRKKDFILYKDIDDNKLKIGGFLKDGNSKRVSKKIVQYINRELAIEEIINVDLWSKYIALIHFGSLTDVVSNNNNIGIVNDELLFPILLDFDSFGTKSVEENILDNFFKEYISGEKNLFKSIIEDFRSSEYAINRFALVYQDLLNTSLKSDNTIPIVEKYEQEVMKLYDEMYYSWGGFPNGGIAPEKQAELYIRLKEFYQNRPEKCFRFLNEFLSEKYKSPLRNKNTIKINFDYIPKDIVKVQLNSLEIFDNFEGFYLSEPYLHFSYQVDENYDVYIEEFVNMANAFKISTENPITITFQLNKKN